MKIYVVRMYVYTYSYMLAKIFQTNQLLYPRDIFIAPSVWATETVRDSNRTHETLQLDYGQFYLTLEGSGSDECYTAFDVIPKEGYRHTDVKLLVIDPKMLDYDEGSCNDIIVKVRQSYDLFCRFSGIRYGAKAKITWIYWATSWNLNLTL